MTPLVRVIMAVSGIICCGIAVFIGVNISEDTTNIDGPLYVPLVLALSATAGLLIGFSLIG